MPTFIYYLFAVIKHPTNQLPPNQPINKHTARVGSGLGALTVKKKAAASTAQEEILLELKPKNNQENPALQSKEI
ncbi:MAG: hypothetical protein DHS20C18_49790 [Saprospiraceae bacterium]|nr:MAG: hypothetical protein DHS20C18_49790 [Saprospiraceae bacterium]